MNKNATILVIDDDLIDTEDIIRSLRARDISNTIIAAKNGFDALDYLTGSNERDIILGPLIVLLDINMPGMNGLEFLKTLRTLEGHKDTIVFVVTTSSQSSDIEASYSLGVSGYITKDSSGIDLLKKLVVIENFLEYVTLPG